MDRGVRSLTGTVGGRSGALFGGRIGAIADIEASRAFSVVPIVTPSRSAAQSRSSRRMPQRFAAQVREHLTALISNFGIIVPIGMLALHLALPRLDNNSHYGILQSSGEWPWLAGNLAWWSKTNPNQRRRGRSLRRR